MKISKILKKVMNKLFLNRKICRFKHLIFNKQFTILSIVDSSPKQ